MIFELALRTRGTDCGPDRWVTLPHVISYMEHGRWAWMSTPELGLSESVHQGFGFFMVRQQVALCRRFGQGLDTQVRSVLRHIGRAEARGEQDVVRSDGVRLAHSSMRGVWVGPTGRLARIPRAAADSVSSSPLAADRGQAEAHSASSLFTPPQPLRDEGPGPSLSDEVPDRVHRRKMAVRASDCDIFQHVNAANYVRFVADSLAVQGASPSLHRADLQYVGQARAGDAIEVVTWSVSEGRWGAVIHRDDEVLFRAAVDTEVVSR